ncbi:MAG: hypothetical protein GY811_24325 [Myxococcales bacterium]|nr:hypothetical protein [Myxococcales bacterium]
MRTVPTLSALASALGLAAAIGCGGGQTTAPPSEHAAPEVRKQNRVTNMHMHFDDITAIQVALVSGNVVAARELAKKFREGFQGEKPQGWGPYIERSVASAEMLEVTDDLHMAARIAGTMAGTCGDCHRDQEINVVEHAAIAPPRNDDRFSDFMIQHRWAADRMWEGLIGPSDEAWRAGALALAGTEITREDIAERLLLTPEIERLLVQIRKDAAAASSVHGADMRQELYGSFLAGCASCHRDMMNQRD